MSITFSKEYVPGDPPTDYDEDIYFNAANTNAFRILSALGIEPDCCGSIDAADLAGRILTAMAVGHAEFADPANPGQVITGDGGATLIDCSRPLDEYLADRLPALLAVTQDAMSLGRDVQWG